MTVILLLSLVTLVVVPTGGMYREAAAYDPENVVVWTLAMLVLAVVVPIVGPVVLWLVYTAVVVRSGA